MTEEKKTPKRMTRRNFLKTSAAAAASVAVGTLTMKSWSAEAAPMPKKWQETFDVVVIGSGFAGLAAAYEAKKAGSSVVVLEKMRTPGGNSIINGGAVSAAGSPLEAKEGIKDSPELLLKDMLTAGLNLNHVKLAKMVATSPWIRSCGPSTNSTSNTRISWPRRVVIPFHECTALITRAVRPS